MPVLPPPDPGLIARRAAIAADLRRLVPGVSVLEAASERLAYECDALTAHRSPPLLVVLPRTTAEVAAILRYCHDHAVPVVPRGAGTSLSGGATPMADAVLLGMARFNRILEIDRENRCATVEPGVTNLAISQAVAGLGLFYAPDPSSQIACTIGGNVAENSGGVHCLKYGLTTNNVIGVEFVTIEGEIIDIGGKAYGAPGYDVLGALVGSEGLLGIVTRVTVRLLPLPPVARALLIGFATVEQAAATVGAIIAAGIIPAGMEMMDRPAILAAEAFVHAGYPRDVDALLIVELDGCPVEVDDLVARVAALAGENNATICRASRSDAERALFWAGRKAAFPAVGRLAPDYLCMDGTIPRRRLPEMLGRITEMEARFGLKVANVFHAGDGNLHPLIMFDANLPDQTEQAEAFGAEILRLCVAMGGALSGEHGIGLEKRDLMPEMFSERDLEQQMRLKCAFDAGALLNPGKVFPTPCRCAELGKMHVHRGDLRFADLPRF